MEAAKIDWNKIESVFVVDHVFENINAPQWVDFLSSPSQSPSSSDDDVAWFCRPECKHPATAEDFLNSTPSSTSKLLRSVSVSKLIGLGDWSRKEGSVLKRRASPIQDDTENQNPNLSQSNYYYYYNGKNPDEFSERSKESKELLGGTGRDIFGKISELCNELKKITRVKEREEGSNVKVKALDSVPVAKQNEKEKKMNDCDKERKPLLQLKPQAPKLRRNLRNMNVDESESETESENIPISLNLNNVKTKISPIRTNPPTPQGFSATRNPLKPTSSKSSSKLMDMESEFLQEFGHKKTLKDELDDHKSDNDSASLVPAKQGRTLDMFWFLKPCTLSS